MAKAKAAVTDVLISIILGIGGREHSREHIEKTVALLNILQPEELAPMALAVQPGTELAGQVETGEFVLPTPRQVLEEEQYLLENLGDFSLFYWGDHGNNIVSSKGWLPAERQPFLEKINHAIETSPAARDEVLRTYAW